MKNGYYIFAYIEINKFANYYKTDTKRHDQNLSLWKYNNGNLSLVRYWELERLSRIKHHNKAFSSEDQFKNLLKSLLDEFKLKLTDINEIFAYPYLNKKIEYIDKNYNYHSMCHLFSSLLLDTSIFYYEDILAFSVDLESDYISEKKDSKKNDYVGCFSQKGKLSFFPIESPAPLWSAVSHDLKLGEGTLMALSSALKTEFINNLDFSDERFFKYNYEKTIKTYQKIKELASACNKDNVKTTLKNYNNKFSFDDNLKSAIMKVIQKISLSTMERNVEYAIQTFKINLKETILAISGGFALNCPTNSSLLNSYKFKNFIAPPCVNDSGQSLGMALYHFYLNARKQLKFSLDTAFYGKHYSTKNAINLYRNYIVSVNCSKVSSCE